MLINRLIVDSYPQFLPSRLGTPGTMTHHSARTHEKKRNACIFSLADIASSTNKKLKEEKVRNILEVFSTKEAYSTILDKLKASWQPLLREEF